MNDEEKNQQRDEAILVIWLLAVGIIGTLGALLAFVLT
jgi:hypothetical protein